MKFSGKLAAFGLYELVNLLEQLQFQGTLRLKRKQEQALVVFDGDELYFPLPQRLGTRRARVRIRAERLLRRICAWTDVGFDTHPNRIPPQASGQFRVHTSVLQRLCQVPQKANEQAFSGTLAGRSLIVLGAVLHGMRSSGVLLVDDGTRATSVFYHSGTPFRRSTARRPSLSRGEVVIRWAGGLRKELVVHPERFQRIRKGWPSMAA